MGIEPDAPETRGDAGTWEGGSKGFRAEGRLGNTVAPGGGDAVCMGRELAAMGEATAPATCKGAGAGAGAGTPGLTMTVALPGAGPGVMATEGGDTGLGRGPATAGAVDSGSAVAICIALADWPVLFWLPAD
jgi:hypothetical protein